MKKIIWFKVNFLIFGLILLPKFNNAYDEDLINNLPGVKFDLPFKHYSGFLKGSKTHQLHYWFVESQKNPAKDPLLFWFNGGPGCSSLDGILNEMGPYLVNPDGKTLRSNPNSWNKFASIVYIESPAGVGFSYSTDGNITTDDDQTSLESYNAIKDFFGKFPQFRKLPTFITGESYGGIYVPTLTARIIDGQNDFKINLQGMAIGNGYLNADLNIDSTIRFAYSHGLIDETSYSNLELICCHGCIDGCDLSKLDGKCAKIVSKIFLFIWKGGLNPYDLYRDCDLNTNFNNTKTKNIAHGVMPTLKRLKLFDENNYFSYSSFNFHKNKFKENKQKSFTVPCLNDTDVTTFLNNRNVRQALNIPNNFPEWKICNDDISDNYIKIYRDMAPFVTKILDANVRVLLYYGDTDMACNFLLGQQFSARLGFNKTLSKISWKFNRQIAGFKTIYERSASTLTYLTVRGAGHMAPQWKAPEMNYVMNQFLSNNQI